MQQQSIDQKDHSTNKWLAMTGVGMGVLMGTLDAGIVNISLPTLVTTFGTDFATIQWVVLSYLLIITSLMLSVARAGDIIGKKKVYMTGLVLFTVGSLLCGLAPTVGWLIGFRALQGTGAVMLTALGTAIITEVFPVSERGRALGIMGSIVSIGIAAGPMLGGVLIGLVGWQAVFLVNVPIGIAAFFIVLRVVPALEPRNPNQRFDIPGALLIFFVLSVYALGMTLGQNRGFGDSRIIGMLIIAGVGLGIFVLVELRVKQPMLDLSMFRNILFSLNLIMGFFTFVMIGGFFIFPFFLELVQGYSTEQVGLLMAVFPVLMGVSAPFSGALSDRFGSRLISMIGLGVIVFGCFTISVLSEDTSALGFVLLLAPLGLGFGIFQSPNNSAIMGSAPLEKLGVASGLLALTRTLGQTTGLPLMGSLFTGQVLSTGLIELGTDITLAPAPALVQGVNGTFRIAAVFMLVATILAAAALVIDRGMISDRA